MPPHSRPTEHALPPSGPPLATHSIRAGPHTAGPSAIARRVTATKRNPRRCLLKARRRAGRPVPAVAFRRRLRLLLLNRSRNWPLPTHGQAGPAVSVLHPCSVFRPGSVSVWRKDAHPLKRRGGECPSAQVQSREGGAP